MKCNPCIQVGSSKIQPSTAVRDLGLHPDSKLSMKHYLAKVAAVCYYRLLTACRPRSSNLAGACNGDVKTGLLQCSTGRSTTGDSRTTTTSPELSRSLDLRAENCVCYSCTSYHMLARPNQTLLYRALSLLLDVSSISSEHYRHCQCQLNIFWSSSNVVDGLHTVTAAQSSVNVRSNKLVPPHGTHCLKMWAPWRT